MSRETEKIFKAFHKHIEGKDLSEDEVNEELQNFMQIYNKNISASHQAGHLRNTEMTVDDYLDLAYDADTAEEAVKNAEKALKLDKNCLDARLILIQNEDSLEKAKDQLEKAIKSETKRLEKEGYFHEEEIGHFYGILETRPYMRARSIYVDMLVSSGRIRKAVFECEDMIRLNENDNMGMRHKLMTLYAVLEEPEKAEALFKKFGSEESFMLLLPLAVLYYKIDDEKKAYYTLERITKKNTDYLDFIKGKKKIDEEDYAGVSERGGYRPYSIEEVMIGFEENRILSPALEFFNLWAADQLKKKSVKKSSRKKK